VQVRAHRRHKQLVAAGKTDDFDSVLFDMQERDRKDSSRAVGPLAKPADAVIIDSTEITVEGVVNVIIKSINVSPFVIPQPLLSQCHPLPTAVRKDGNGRIYAFWAMAFGVAEWFLIREREGRLPVCLDREATIEIAQYLDEAYGLTNVERPDVEGPKQVFVSETLLIIWKNLACTSCKRCDLHLSVSPEELATWARRNGYIEDVLQTFFNEHGCIKMGKKRRC